MSLKSLKNVAMMEKMMKELISMVTLNLSTTFSSNWVQSYDRQMNPFFVIERKNHSLAQKNETPNKNRENLLKNLSLKTTSYQESGGSTK